MLIVTFANFFAIFLTLLGRLVKKEKLCFFLSSLFLIIFYSIRTDYGNDIPGYIETFNRLSDLDYSYLADNEEHVEPGWIILNIIFAPLGWQVFITFLTIVQFGTVYWLINKYATRCFYWLVFSFYVLTSNLLLTDLSMIRQALAMHIVAWTIPLFLNNKPIKSIIIILLASTIHTSAFAALALIIFSLIKRVNPKIIAIVFLCLFIILFITESIVGDTLEIFLQSETFHRYNVYEEEGSNNGTGLGILLYAFTGTWLLLKYSKNNKTYFFSFVFFLFVLMIPFSKSVQIVDRIGMYFNLISIIVMSFLINYNKDKIGFICMLALFYISFSGYFAFFENPVWHNAYANYLTIFD